MTEDDLYVHDILAASPVNKARDEVIGMGRVWLASMAVWIIFLLGLYFTLFHN